MLSALEASAVMCYVVVVVVGVVVVVWSAISSLLFNSVRCSCSVLDMTVSP